MLLTITNRTKSNISIGGRVGTIRGGATSTYEVTISELEALRTKLVALQEAGNMLFSTAASTGTTDDGAEGATIGMTNVVVETETGTTRTLTVRDNGKTIVFTNAAGCTVTVPELYQNFSCSFVQDTGAGAVTLAAGTGVTFLAPTSVSAPYTTAEVGATMGITMLSSVRALVYGAIS
jgi:RNase P/RNase MRP subunit p29